MTAPVLFGAGWSSFKGKRMFVCSPEDRFPFSFGPGKAQQILDIIEQNGADAFVEALQYLVDNPESDQHEAA